MKDDFTKAERRWEKRSLFKRRNTIPIIWLLWLVVLSGALITAIFFVLPFFENG